MRRKDREMSAEFAWHVVDTCEYATLCTADAQNKPYGVTLSIVREDDKIYFHCAREGFKIDCLRLHPDVCMTCVGHTFRPDDDFTTAYESAVLRGTAEEVTDDSEKIHALRLLCQRHNPANMAAFDTAIEKSLWRTAVWKINVSEITGKCKEIPS